MLSTDKVTSILISSNPFSIVCDLAHKEQMKMKKSKYRYQGTKHLQWDGITLAQWKLLHPGPLVVAPALPSGPSGVYHVARKRTLAKRAANREKRATQHKQE